MLGAVALLGPPAAVAREDPPPADAPASIEALVTQARSATRRCRAGELDETAAELAALEVELGRQLGATHALTQRVRLTLARVERERGEVERAASLEAPRDAEGEAPDRDDLKPLDRVLKKLRACPPRQRASTPLAAGSLEDELGAATLELQAGRYRDAGPHAERAYALSALGADPATRLRAAETLAQARLLAGDARALEAARAAEQAAAEVGALESRIAIARLLARAGDLDAATQSLDAIAPLVDEAALLAELEEARGDLALQLGSPGTAIEHLQRAIDGHRRTARSQESLAAVLQLAGDAYRAAGNYPDAAAAYDEARALRIAALGKDHPETARTINAIGVLYSDFGNDTQANAEFERAAEILTRSLGPEHPETLLIAVNQALSRWSARRDEASARGYESAVDGWAEALGDSHPSVAEAWRNLAWMEIELGHGERAEALLESALKTQRSSLGKDHPSVALTHLARGRLLLRRGKPELARVEVERALAIQRAAYGEEHPSVARARIQLSRIAATAGDSKLAWSEAREAARLLDLHVRRSFGAMTDRQRTLLAAQARDVVGALLSADDTPDQELFAALLPHRDSVIRSIAGQRARAGEADPKRRELLEELANLRARYAAVSLSQSQGSAQRLTELVQRIDALETRAALSGIDREESDAQRLLFRACERLPRDAALVEFVAYDRSQPGASKPTPAYAAMVVRGDGCSVERVELGDAEPIDAAAESFARSMREQISDAPEARAALSASVLAPLRQALADSARWMMVPDGSLWGVPFGALPDPEQPGRYLIERVTVGYLTSLHELAQSERKPFAGTERRSLLFGAPEFGTAVDGRGPVVLTASGPCSLAPFQPLPGTRREIEEISALLPNPRVVTGSDATRTRLLQELEARPSILHLATHAYFAGGSECESERPTSDAADERPRRIAPNPLLLSGIALAGANGAKEVASQPRDGSAILTAYESAGLDLRDTRLVVLSACDTGTGLQQRGQEVQGLRWGFRAAGARALVTSLWRSNDRATRQLMLHLYEALESEALPKDVFAGAEALRRAQLERVGSDARLGLARPLLWSNFVFSGVL